MRAYRRLSVRLSKRDRKQLRQLLRKGIARTAASARPLGAAEPAHRLRHPVSRRGRDAARSRGEAARRSLRFSRRAAHLGADTRDLPEQGYDRPKTFKSLQGGSAASFNGLYRKRPRFSLRASARETLPAGASDTTLFIVDIYHSGRADGQASGLTSACATSGRCGIPIPPAL